MLHDVPRTAIHLVATWQFKECLLKIEAIIPANVLYIVVRWYPNVIFDV